MKVVLEISEKEIERLHELIGIPEETSPLESVDEADIVMAIHTLIESA